MKGDGHTFCEQKRIVYIQLEFSSKIRDAFIILYINPFNDPKDPKSLDHDFDLTYDLVY